MRKFKIFIYTFNFNGKIYPILVPFSIFPLKCMVKMILKMCLETHVADEAKLDYNYAISFRTMSKLHLSSTVSLDFIIVFK